MGQISFKIPDDELEFLKWYSERTANSISTLYRDATIETYKKWKLSILTKLYANGALGFKQLCRYGSISYQEGMLLLEEQEIEPPISEAIDKYTEEVTQKILDGITFNEF